jgi:hypothetical protein
MADRNSALGWTAEQWDKVNGAIAESFGKASVASELFEGDCYGPLAPSEEYVREVTLKADVPKVTVQDDLTVKLFNLTVKVELSNEQVSELGLSNALVAFRRAANLLAQGEDYIVFNGFAQDEHEKTHEVATAHAGKKPLDKKQRMALMIASSPKGNVPGLARLRDQSKLPKLVARYKSPAKAPTVKGAAVVEEIVKAVGALDTGFHTQPFACVLGMKLFEAVYSPSDSMVMPADRIKELLGPQSNRSSARGWLLRSAQLEDYEGIVLSRADNEIDVVVATPPTAQLLNVTNEATYLFRVYEKFMLRIKDETAVQRFDFE